MTTQAVTTTTQLRYLRDRARTLLARIDDVLLARQGSPRTVGDYSDCYCVDLIDEGVRRLFASWKYAGLPPSKRVEMARAEEGKARRPRGRPPKNKPPTGENFAARQRRVLKAGRFASAGAYYRACLVVDRGVEELVRLVDGGDVSVGAAAVVARLPKEQQRQVVEVVRRGGEVRDGLEAVRRGRAAAEGASPPARGRAATRTGPGRERPEPQRSSG